MHQPRNMFTSAKSVGIIWKAANIEKIFNVGNTCACTQTYTQNFLVCAVPYLLLACSDVQIGPIHVFQIYRNKHGIFLSSGEIRK